MEPPGPDQFSRCSTPVGLTTFKIWTLSQEFALEVYSEDTQNVRAPVTFIDGNQY